MYKPGHPCSHFGCTTLVTGRYCRFHRPKILYNDSKWHAYSRNFLRKHKICADPEKRHMGKIVRSEVVGHRIAFGADEFMFWSRQNHIPLCRSCNSAQCCKIEGGFGNAVQI